MVETARGLCALKPAEDSAALSRAGLKSLEQSAAYATEPRVRRYVVQQNFASVGDHPDSDNRVTFDCNEHCCVLPGDPGADIFRRLVAEPPRQNLGIVTMVSRA